MIFAYVIMPDHFHLITDSAIKPSEVLRFVKGITARRVIDYLETRGFHSSLEKLKHRPGTRGYKYSLWQHHSNALLISAENLLMQKVNYIHNNPVRAGMVATSDEFIFSSSRIWHRRSISDEPLEVDASEIRWHR